MALSRDSILRHAGSFKAHPVHVPAWRDDSGDDVVLVRGMTVREFELNQDRSKSGESTASIISRCVIDENGVRLFDDSDVNQIANLPLAQIQDLSEAIAKASGMGDEADLDSGIKTAVTRAEGNSETTTGDGTSSD